MTLQNLCNPISVSLAFQKALNYQNLTTESGFMQRFSFLQEKVVIQAVCLGTQTVLDLKEGLYVFWKSQKIAYSLRPILFELCINRTSGRGSNWPPLLPAGIGLKELPKNLICVSVLERYTRYFCFSFYIFFFRRYLPTFIK